MSRKNTCQAPIIAILDAPNCPEGGYTSKQIRDATQLTEQSAHDALKVLVRNDVVKRHGTLRNYFYTRTDAQREALAARMAQLSAPKLRSIPKAPDAQTVMRKRPERPVPPKRADLPVITPAHVKVQYCPSGEDTRFKIAPGQPLTAGFSEEWRRLRGGTA